MAAEGWEEEEIYTKGTVDGQKKREGVHYNSKSNMASQMNDRELITLARPNETPAGWFSSYRSFLKSTISNYWTEAI